MNELLWIVFGAIVNFSFLIIMYHLFGKSGLFVWVRMATVIANFQVLKTIKLFGLTATMGNIIYGTAFFAADIIKPFFYLAKRCRFRKHPNINFQLSYPERRHCHD